MSQRFPPALPSPSSDVVLGSPFQLRKLLHRHSDPQFSDVDLFDAVDMGEHAAWANLDEPIYAEKDFEIYRPQQTLSSLPVYYTKGWLPYSADTLFNALADAQYRKAWDKQIKDVYVLDQQKNSDVLYCAVNMPWPFSYRDYVYQRRSKYFAKQNAFVIICQSTQHCNAPEPKNTVRVETFSTRMSIRSTGTNSCDFYMEYEDDTNFTIPNYMINWLVSVKVPGFMNDLRKACAQYASYAKALDLGAAHFIPSQVARRRAEEQQGIMRVVVGSPSSLQKTESSSSSTEQSRWSPKRRKSARRLRRQLTFGTEDKSDGDLSSSSDRSRRARRLFQRKSEDKKEGKGSLRKTLKKTNSMSTLFSSKTSSSRAPSNPLGGEHFVVDFYKQKVGLHLETEVFTNRVLVAFCEKHSEAAKSPVPIEPGMIVTSINGKCVGDMVFDEIIYEIKRSARPLTLGFTSSTRETKSFRRFKEPRNVFKCVHMRDESSLLRVLRPLDGDANLGAVLKFAFEGTRYSKRALESSKFGDPTSRMKLGSSSPTKKLETVVIPEGYLLYEIDHCHVLNLPFAEIAHLLSRNTEPRVVSFKAAIAVIGDQAGADPARSALSKRLSGVFRWRSGSTEQPPMSVDTNATAPAGWGGISDSDIRTDDGRGDGFSDTGSAVCLPDYSRVKITPRNLEWAWEQVHLLKTDERIFSAALLIDRIEAFFMGNNAHSQSTTMMTVFNKMHEEREWINQIKDRHTLGVKALHEFNNEEDADWIFGQTYFGVSTHWKPGADGTVWLKLDGLVEGVDIFNTIAVMREIDLFSCWVPFCNQSLTLHKAGHVDILVYMSMIFPLLKRDAIIRAVGINACYESRCILLLGGSVDESKVPSNVEVPRLKGWNADRLDMRAFRVLIEPITRTKGRTCIVCNIDPKCPVPRSLLNFAVKKIAGILLFLLRKEAEKIEKAQQDGSPSDHVDRLKADPDKFYEWLRPLVDRWFLDLQSDRLPPQLKFPKQTELDLLRDGNDASSTTSIGTSTDVSDVSEGLHESRDSWHGRPTAPPISSSTLITSNEQVESTPVSRRSQSLSVTQVFVSDKRTWVDYLYDFGIWPYFLLVIFARVTPEDPFWYVCGLKFIFTCTCTWFGVPGAFSWQTRQLKRARMELDSLRRRFVMLAALYDVLNSWVVAVWANWLLCYVPVAYPDASTCLARPSMELRASENFWLEASAFTFASIVVGIQVIVNI